MWMLALTYIDEGGVFFVFFLSKHVKDSEKTNKICV